MQKIKAFVRKYFWLLFVILTVVAYFANLALREKPEVKPTPAPIKANFRSSITPGVSSEADLNKVLGNPVRSTTADGQKTNEYRSTSELRLHDAVIVDGKVIFVKEVVSAHDVLDSSTIIGIYGEPPNVLYDPSPNAVFNLYVYPSNGIAYLGAEDGTLLEIWYFIPTSFADFQSRWAKSYLISPPTEQFQ